MDPEGGHRAVARSDRQARVLRRQCCLLPVDDDHIPCRATGHLRPWTHWTGSASALTRCATARFTSSCTRSALIAIAAAGMADAVGPQSSFSTGDRFATGSSLLDTNSLTELSVVDDEGERSA